MSAAPAEFTLTPIRVPAAADDADAGDFRLMSDLRNRINEVVRGQQAVPASAAQMLPAWHDQEDEQIHGFLVRADGEAVGRALLYVPQEPGSRVVDIRIEILPEWWRRGAGRAAHGHLEQLARSFGRTVARGWTDHLDLGGDRITAATGWGSVPADHVARSLGAAGYSLEQVYRASALDLATSSTTVDRILADARAAASAYRYLSWMLPTPPEHRAGYARLKARMSTDAPAGGVEWDEETWTQDRIRRMDERLIAQGYTGLIGAAQHIESGELAAFTELYILDDRTLPTSQNDTLVLADHRGHRLGALVKCETLLRWRQLVPESSRILTNNAEENRPMLAINEEMGFEPIAYAGMWQKQISG